MTGWHVVDDGAGAPVVAIHGGLGLDHSYLRRGLAPLAARARVLYVDLPGNGATPADVAGPELTAWADGLDAVRAARGLERWSVLGHSWGGFAALTYAARYPDRLDRLVLIGAGPSMAHAPAALAAIDQRGQPAAVAALLAALGAPAADDASFARTWRDVLPLYFHRWEPRYEDAFAATRYRAAGYNHGAAQLATLDLTPTLPTIPAPTLLVTGDDDFIMPAHLAAAALAAGLPDARSALVSDAGHFPFLEAPGPTLAAIADFLA